MSILLVIVVLTTGYLIAEDKKCLCQILGKLTLPKEIDRTMLYTAYILISNLVEVTQVFRCSELI